MLIKLNRSPNIPAINSEEIICEEARHYSLYNERNSEHDPFLLQRSNSPKSVEKASSSPKRALKGLKQASNESSHGTITKLFQGLTRTMRDAATYFHESENSTSDSERSVETSSTFPVSFKRGKANIQVPPETSDSNTPKAPSLMGVGISRTPFMSEMSLDPAWTSESKMSLDPASLFESETYTELTLEPSNTGESYSKDSGLASDVSHQSKSIPMQEIGGLPKDPIKDAAATMLEPNVDMMIRLQMSSSNPERGSENAADQGKVPLDRRVKRLELNLGQTNENLSPTHGYTSDVESNCELPQPPHSVIPSAVSEKSSSSSKLPIACHRTPRCSSPPVFGEVQNKTNLQSSRALAEDPHGLSATNAHPMGTPRILPSRTFADNYDADAEKSDLEPNMGSREAWLEAHADRERRYQATMSSTSTDDDSDVGVELTRASDPHEHRLCEGRAHPCIHIKHCSRKNIAVDADKCVSPLSLSKQTLSPASVPLPKLEALTRTSELETPEQSSSSPLPTIKQMPSPVSGELPHWIHWILDPETTSQSSYVPSWPSDLSKIRQFSELPTSYSSPATDEGTSTLAFHLEAAKHLDLKPVNLSSYRTSPPALLRIESCDKMPVGSCHASPTDSEKMMSLEDDDDVGWRFKEHNEHQDKILQSSPKQALEKSVDEILSHPTPPTPSLTLRDEINGLRLPNVAVSSPSLPSSTANAHGSSNSEDELQPCPCPQHSKSFTINEIPRATALGKSLDKILSHPTPWPPFITLRDELAGLDLPNIDDRSSRFPSSTISQQGCSTPEENDAPCPCPQHSENIISSNETPHAIDLFRTFSPETYSLLDKDDVRVMEALRGARIAKAGVRNILDEAEDEEENENDKIAKEREPDWSEQLRRVPW